MKDCSKGLCSTPYCLQWCHLIDPPLPSGPPAVVNNFSEAHSAPNFSPTVIVIIGILLGASLLISYYLALSNICGNVAAASAAAGPRHNNSRSRRYPNEERVVLGIPQPYYEGPSWYVARAGLDEAAIRGVGECEYRRGEGLVEATDCVVCLGEFQEGETLRLLPKCIHAFHVSCIDRWFQSHTNCPLCRANVVPSSPSEAAADTVAANGRENYESSLTQPQLDSYHFQRREGNDGCVVVVVVVEARRSGDNVGAHMDLEGNQ